MNKNMSETLTAPTGNAIQSPTYRGDEEGPFKELASDKRHILDLQLADHARLNETDLQSQLRDRLANGDTALPIGTLIHGTRYSDEAVASIAAHGVMSGELFGILEDSETHYCADFFRTNHNTTVADYSHWITEIENLTSALRKRRMEGDFLPTPTDRVERMGIIIDPTIPELQSLLEADAYRSGTDELFRGIINRLPVDKTDPKAERLSAVLGGVPRGAIAGIVVSPRLAENAEHIAHMRSVFGENVPLLTVEGQLVKGEVSKVPQTA